MTDTDPTLDLLEAYLNSPDLDDGVMTLSELDGFFAGLAAGPQDIATEEWLPLLWGDAPPVFADDDQAAAILGAVMALHDSVAAQILAGDYAPLLDIGDDGVPLPQAWAVGFMTAAGLREDAWRPLLESEDDDYLVYPIIAFCEDEAGRPLLELSPRDRETLRADAPDQIAGAVLDLAEHWGRRPKTPPPQPIVRAGPKVGRNDPCPCGSGKKHKKCCGA